MSILCIPDELMYDIAVSAANVNIFAAGKSFYKHRDQALSELSLNISDVSDPDTARLLCLINSSTNSILNVHPAARSDTDIVNLMLKRSAGADYLNLNDNLKERFFQSALIHSSGYMFQQLPNEIQSLAEAIDTAAELIGVSSESNLSSHDLAMTIHDIIEHTLQN